MTKERQNSSTFNGIDLLAYMSEIIANELEKSKIEPHAASQIALNTLDTMRLNFGGQLIYFPSGQSIERDKFLEEVWQKFSNGVSVKELAQEYKKSIQHIYKTIAKKRAMLKAEREAKYSSH